MIQAGPKALQAWRAKQEAAAAVARQQEEERARAEAQDVAAGLLRSERLARSRKETVQISEAGAVVVLARDGLHWLFVRGKIGRAHLDACLKFRRDWERAHGTGVQSSLSDGQPRTPTPPNTRTLATDTMLDAKDAVEAALRALSSPMLEPYLIRVAAQGEMLNALSPNSNARELFLPCVIAFDSLARFYGMIR